MSEKRNGETLRIESIKAKDGLFTLSFSDGEKLVLGIDSFTEFRLYAEKELTADEYAKLLAFAKQDECYRLALRRLSHDIYSKREVREYLLGKGQEPEVVEKVIQRLLAADLLNDERYAVTFAEDVADLRLLGRNQILFTLRSKGISPKILDRLSFPREKELEKATRFAKAADRRYHRTPKGKRVFKIANALLHRGYDESVAYEAAENCATPDDPEMVSQELRKAFNLAYAKYARKYEGYELRQHVLANLARKGYSYDDIKALCEEEGL